MSIDTVLSAVNGAGSAVTSTITTILTVNYFVAQNTINLACLILHQMKSATIYLLTAIYIALEDLSVFLVESGESVISLIEYIFFLIDASLLCIVNFYTSVKTTILCVGNSFTSGCAQFLNASASASQNFGHALNLFGSSVVLLISFIPQTCKIIYSALTSFFMSMWEGGINIVKSTVDAICNAPVETFLGFVGAILIMISLFRLTQRLIRNNSITTAHVLRFSLHAMCFFYIHVIKYIILGIRGVIRMVGVTLTHMHVTRFHHAGDSDAEGEVDNQGLIGHYDDSDENENERMTDKRRNYDLLLRRTKERRLKKKKKTSGKGGNRKEPDTDVEDMLLEQVEMEREDKLCVVCQDKEKCIMILPCRHLCICTDCEGPLQLRNNHCPICRRLVRQTIKAYL